MKRVLIIGEHSYIGDNFAAHVAGDETFAVDIVDSRDGKWKGADFARYDSVFLVAGIAHYTKKIKNSEMYFEVNAKLASEIGEYVKLHGARQLIFMSSITIYNEAHGEIIRKDTQPAAKGPYAESKLQADVKLQSLADGTFSVAIIRPPMIFGAGCKGNFPRLIGLAKKIHMFPDFANQRSMLYIENLSEFVKQLVLKGCGGLFFPQNREYFSTTEIVRIFAKSCGVKVLFLKLFNPVIRLLRNRITVINKMFGNLCYEAEMSLYPELPYQLYDKKTSVEKSLQTEVADA